MQADAPGPCLRYRHHDDNHEQHGDQQHDHQPMHQAQGEGELRDSRLHGADLRRAGLGPAALGSGGSRVACVKETAYTAEQKGRT